MKCTDERSSPATIRVRKPVFLSSLFQDLRLLRQCLHASFPRDLFVAEEDRKDLAPEQKQPLEIVDALIQQLQESELLICILAGKRIGPRQMGTRIEVEGRQALVSYFEVEVFQAALHQIPIVFIECGDFEPGKELAELLDILRASHAITRWVTTTARSEDCGRVVAEVRSAIDSNEVLRHAASEHLAVAASKLATALLSKRARLLDVRSGRRDMLFLAGAAMHSDEASGLDDARAFLQAAKNERNHAYRLTRLYLALRTLMKYPYQNCEDPEVLELWNELFGLWWSSAAWYGLHNHLSVGVLGALWSLDYVRETLRRSRRTSDCRGLAPPFGELASAYYSLSRLVQGLALRRRVAASGIKLANDRIRLGSEDDASIYAVRGSLFFVRANPARGMKDFCHFHSLARKAPDNIALNAEAQSYLGRGYGFLGQHKLAERHATEAVKLWRCQVERDGRGKEFLIKTLKFMLEIQLRLGHKAKAIGTAREAFQHSEEVGAFDQTRQIVAMLNKANLPVPHALD